MYVCIHVSFASASAKNVFMYVRTHVWSGPVWSGRYVNTLPYMESVVILAKLMCKHMYVYLYIYIYGYTHVNWYAASHNLRIYLYVSTYTYMHTDVHTPVQP